MSNSELQPGDRVISHSNQIAPGETLEVCYVDTGLKFAACKRIGSVGEMFISLKRLQKEGTPWVEPEAEEFRPVRSPPRRQNSKPAPPKLRKKKTTAETSPKPAASTDQLSLLD